MDGRGPTSMVINHVYESWDDPPTMGTHVSFIFRGYNPYIGSLKPSFFHGFWGPREVNIVSKISCFKIPKSVSYPGETSMGNWGVRGS